VFQWGLPAPSAPCVKTESLRITGYCKHAHHRVLQTRKDGIIEQPRYSYRELSRFVTALFEGAGLPAERAAVMAEVFIEGDLLGFTTHGTNRVVSNLQWLESGRSSGQAPKRSPGQR